MDTHAKISNKNPSFDREQDFPENKDCGGCIGLNKRKLFIWGLKEALTRREGEPEGPLEAVSVDLTGRGFKGPGRSRETSNSGP